MANERLALDAVLGSSSVTGATVANLDDDPDSPDGSWAVATSNNTNTEVHVSFGTPSGSPTVGADLQEFRVEVRQFDGGQSGTPQARVELWENGALVRAGSDVNVTSATSQVIAFTWNANELATSDGSLVELKIIGTKSGGSPSSRNSVDFGAIEWNAEYTGAQTITPSNVAATGTVPNPSLSLGLTATTIAAAGSVPSPVITTGAVGVTCTAISATGTVPGPTVGLDVSPSAVAATNSVPNPVLGVGAVDVSPSVIAATGSTPNPVLATGAVGVSPSAIAATGSTPGPVLTTGAVDVSPSSIAASGSTPNPVISLGTVDVSPTAIAAAASIPSPVVSQDGGAQNLAPATISSGTTFQLAQIDLYLAASILAAVGDTPNPTITAGAVGLIPGGISATGAVPNPSVGVGAVSVQPSLIAATGSVTGPTLDLFITSQLVAASGSVPTPTVAPGTTTVSPAAITAVGTVPAPMVQGGARTNIYPVVNSLLCDT